MNYLDRLLQRAAGGPEVLRPRTPARFEPAPGTDRASPWNPAVEAVTEVEAPPAAIEGHLVPADSAPPAPGRNRGGEAASPAASVLRPRPGRLLSPAMARPIAVDDRPVTPDSAAPAARATPPTAPPLRPRDPPPLALDRAAQEWPGTAAVRPGPGDPASEAATPPAARRDVPGPGTPAAKEPATQHRETSEAAREPTTTRTSDGDTPAPGSWGRDRPAPFPPPHGPTRPVADPGPAPVTIEIGTIEFRAPPAPAAPAPPVAPRGPAVSLADYLARRGARRGP